MRTLSPSDSVRLIDGFKARLYAPMQCVSFRCGLVAQEEFAVKMITVLALALLLAAGQARADDWFKIKPVDAIESIRRNVELLKAVAPLPNPKCGQRGLTTFCNAVVTAAVRFQIVETPDGRTKEAIQAHFDGRSSATLEVSASYDPAIGTPVDGTIVDALCAAILMTFQPRSTPASAIERYQTVMRRAFNATATGQAGIGRSYDQIAKGSFMVEVDRYSIRCVAAARDQRDDF
ncbi:MAG: hypothetical protein ACRCUE_00140 [Bosea sp. (in: a-proteobacteria)]